MHYIAKNYRCFFYLIKKSFLVATFATFVQAHELKRGGYEVGELTKQWADQGYELVKGYDDVNDLDYYRIDMKYATSCFYLTHKLEFS